MARQGGLIQWEIHGAREGAFFISEVIFDARLVLDLEPFREMSSFLRCLFRGVPL